MKAGGGMLRAFIDLLISPFMLIASLVGRWLRGRA